MFELLVIVLIAATFAKAGRNRSIHYLFWAFLGIVYYALGRVLFSLLLYGGYSIFSTNAREFHVLFGLQLIELFFGILSGMITAFFLGRFSGLSLKLKRPPHNEYKG
jgi:hypothetical protein